MTRINIISHSGVWDYDGPIDPQIEEHETDFSIPNANFIFHNKLPKSGSTTMHDILRKLSQKNLFNYKKMDSSNMDFDHDASLGKRFQMYIFRNLSLTI